MRKWLECLYFLFFEVIIKSVLFFFAVTLFGYLLLSVAPKGEKMIVPIRGQERYMVSETARAKFEQVKISERKNENKSSLNFYMAWLKGLFRGEMGRGLAGQEMAEEIGQRFPVTLTLSLASFALALLISFIMGLLDEGSFTGIGRVVIYLFTSLPAFFFGYLLIAVFGIDFSMTPGRYILPVLTLALSCGIINEMARVISGGIGEEMSRDYIETARAKGLKESALPLFGTVKFHAFRNALIGIFPRVGLLFTIVISGSMVVEQVFNLPGLSYMLLDGLADRDRTRVLVVILLAVVLVRIGSLLADLFYLLLNPRYGQR